MRSARSTAIFSRTPPVRYHATHHAGGVHRISDSMPAAAFRATPLYADYYMKVGLDHSLALPLHVDGDLLVSFVFNRQHRDFGDRERDLLEHLRPQLANLFRASVALAQMRAFEHSPACVPANIVAAPDAPACATATASAGASAATSAGAGSGAFGTSTSESATPAAAWPRLAADRLAALTPREREVLGWVSAGKTNAQIGQIVGASPRTIAKHLERVYQKLGVESRTAAAMRASAPATAPPTRALRDA